MSTASRRNLILAARTLIRRRLRLPGSGCLDEITIALRVLGELADRLECAIPADADVTARVNVIEGTSFEAFMPDASGAATSELDRALVVLAEAGIVVGSMQRAGDQRLVTFSCDVHETGPVVRLSAEAAEALSVALHWLAVAKRSKA